MDHSAFLLEYLDESKGEQVKPAASSAETQPAWGEEAMTEIGAPSFAQLRAQTLDVDVEVEQFIDSALVEHDDIHVNIDVEHQTGDDVEWQTGDSLDIDLDFLAPAAEAEVEEEIEIEVEIDLVADQEQLKLEVAIARNSDSHVWEGLDGEFGVFLATYQTLAVGTQVQLTVHLLDRTFTTAATVRWMRNENTGIWPGVGLEIDVLTPEITTAIQRFGKVRPAMFACF